MAKRRRNSSKCPEPLNTMIDILGAVALGAYTRHKIKEDYRSGHGEESVKAAMMVYGSGALRNGSRGIISLGGLHGLKKGIDDINRMERNQAASISTASTTHSIPDEEILGSVRKPTKSPQNNLWRMHCEDGSMYGVNPDDYNSADEYEQALLDAKSGPSDQDDLLEPKSTLEVTSPKNNRYIWRDHCEDGEPLGIHPEDYKTADDYEEALSLAKERKGKPQL